MTGGREERCAVGWAERPPKCFFSTLPLNEAEKNTREERQRNNKKHNFKISQVRLKDETEKDDVCKS